ncbi:leucine-rich repeat-containing protein 43-like [Acipenser ruthenus]|uniref:leucine-rich repeat-containing protein 43-like n=1 Tax=Acipenser ruthenus TaxID=7906 RepID=UPI0027417861|nr:leucine-rich repeat-containing protein 43-like [Acipenser ruthenus]
MHAGVTYKGAEFSPSTGAQQTLLLVSPSQQQPATYPHVQGAPATNPKQTQSPAFDPLMVATSGSLKSNLFPSRRCVRSIRNLPFLNHGDTSRGLVHPISLSSLQNKTHFDSGTCSGSTVPLLEDPALGAEEEEPASLIEYLSSVHSPWHLSESWGPAADQLRELAVRSPALIDTAFIMSYFRSLRIVDKGVLEIGEDLLKFVNLDEFILSANYITEINLTHLTRTLKVLELCANEISSMKGISCSPPAGLTHLGLGYNKLSSPSEYKYLEASFWPVLLSLDLSFNNLVDLPDLVCKLSSLLRLRTLVFMGNPLALTPSYRGFLVDSLPKLALLDDVRVLPDERHHFKGLAKRKELIVDEAKVIVSIGTVQGIPNPVNPVETETPPEYPIVSYSYHVTYEFLNDHPLSTTDEETADQAKKTPTCCDSERTNNSVQSSQQHQESTHEESRNPSADTAPPAGNKTPGPPQNKVPEDDSSVLLHCTPKVPWAGQIESEYRKVHQQRDLRSLKQFLLRGMRVSVVEQKEHDFLQIKMVHCGCKVYHPVCFAVRLHCVCEERLQTLDSVFKICFCYCETNLLEIQIQQDPN